MAVSSTCYAGKSATAGRRQGIVLVVLMADLQSRQASSRRKIKLRRRKKRRRRRRNRGLEPGKLALTSLCPMSKPQSETATCFRPSLWHVFLLFSVLISHIPLLHCLQNTYPIALQANAACLCLFRANQASSLGAPLFVIISMQDRKSLPCVPLLTQYSLLGSPLMQIMCSQDDQPAPGRVAVDARESKRQIRLPSPPVVEEARGPAEPAVFRPPPRKKPRTRWHADVARNWQNGQEAVAEYEQEPAASRASREEGRIAERQREAHAKQDHGEITQIVDKKKPSPQVLKIHCLERMQNSDTVFEHAKCF